MKVSEAMTREVRVANPNLSICDVACIMAELDAGALPISEHDRLVGMVTAHDFVVRAVAEGKSAMRTKVREIMSREVLFCYEDQDLEEVAKSMAAEKIWRMPVLDRDKRLVGMISLGDLASREEHPARRPVAEIYQLNGRDSRGQLCRLTQSQKGA